MRMIDLTLPLYDFMPVGNVWAWDVPFQARPITTVGEEFGRNEYGSLIRQGIVSMTLIVTMKCR
jgi:hypothetical protein